MAKVYLVTSGSFDAYSVEGIFSTRENAERFLEEKGDEIYDPNEIEEWGLDVPIMDTVVGAWTATIYDDGEVDWPDSPQKSRMNGRESTSYTGTRGIFPSRHFSRAFSAISREHAMQVASDLQREWRNSQPEPREPVPVEHEVIRNDDGSTTVRVKE